jgi:hypothetical protein
MNCYVTSISHIFPAPDFFASAVFISYMHPQLCESYQFLMEKLTVFVL